MPCDNKFSLRVPSLQRSNPDHPKQWLPRSLGAGISASAQLVIFNWKKMGVLFLFFFCYSTGKSGCPFFVMLFLLMAAAGEFAGLTRFSSPPARRLMGNTRWPEEGVSTFLGDKFMGFLFFC